MDAADIVDDSVEALRRRTRVMTSKLRDVETLPESEAAAVLGFEGEGVLGEEADEEDEALEADGN